MEVITMLSNLQNTYDLFKQIPFLVSEVKSLKSELATMNNQIAENNSSYKWITLNEAAKKIGLTTPALRSRIKRDLYPQDIVWKQRSRKSAIFINMVNLEEYL
jgi:hypothetical protein